MRIIPVLDIKNGQAVRAVAGRRDEYRPLESVLTDSTEPVQVAAAIAARGFSELYVADLDAIASGVPEYERYRQFAELGMRLWIDCGLRSAEQAAELDSCADQLMIIAGLESVAGPRTLRQIANEVSLDRLIFSLDLLDGKPRTAAEWGEMHSLEIAMHARDCGLRRIIVLDLASVGIGRGVSTLDLCRTLAECGGYDEIISGGGVRNRADLAKLASAGCTAALVSSALHSGELTAT